MHLTNAPHKVDEVKSEEATNRLKKYQDITTSIIHFRLPKKVQRAVLTIHYAGNCIFFNKKIMMVSKDM